MSIVRGWYGFLAGSLVLWLIVAVPLSAGGDPGARLAELQKQMEDAVSRGQAPPPGLLELYLGVPGATAEVEAAFAGDASAGAEK